ncbi:biotin carboxyl carrier protein [Lewinella aquimaris]|uniref:Biotin carboxyl carrier protein n=1 Tax=Neolewinella aquimaris TaxID=1835722 RepID=A0A840E2B1_9BACT|nr:hypothetical protein [Neolewinella aquimaris]MBB4077882.1 biotin carboxyl carrier protein [Neolewinella aquimaris]
MQQDVTTAGPLQSERSPEVREVIGTPAGWVARNGTLLLVVIVLALGTFAALYTYPTTLVGEMVLTTVDPPRRLLARQDMEIQRVLVADRDTVSVGQTLIVASNGSARFEHVLYLEDQLIEHRGDDAPGLLDLNIPPTLVLGPIQESVYNFQDMQEVYRNLSIRRLDAFTSRELQTMIANAEREVVQLRNLQRALEQQLIQTRTALEAEVQLQQEGLGSADELAQAKQRLDRAEENLQRNTGNLRSVSFSIELMRNQIESYRSGRQGSTTQTASELKEAYQALQRTVATWKRDFTVVSPVSGTVVLQPDVREDNFLLKETMVATVLPLNAGNTIGVMKLHIRGSGKVSVGQRVVVQFPSWPSLEYGSVAGTVASVGVIPDGEYLTVEVTFPNGLLSSTGYRIESTPFMQGEATIIVERKSLIARLLNFG